MQTDNLFAALSETAALVADARCAGVSATVAASAAHRSISPRLTAAQRRRVRELMEDEGETRASAVAWVLNMEPAGVGEYR